MATRTKSKSKTGTTKSPPADSAAKKVRVGGKTLTLTHLEKIYWPDEQITKGQLIEYYNSIHSFILPHLKNRPQSLRRNPNGIDDEGFFQKDAGDDIPPWIKTISIHAESSHRDVNYILCNNTPTLIYLNNLGCIELNPWNSTVKNLDNPSYLVLDIDPPTGPVPFNNVIDAALAIREVLDGVGMASYCKTSGASGMHVYVPLGGKFSYEKIRPLAHSIADATQKMLPGTTTTERSLDKRERKIYLDYLQNSKGQTLASVYSVRPVKGATVSTPLLWKEVKHGLSPEQFTLSNVPRRIDRLGDIFADVLKKEIDFTKGVRTLEDSLEKISK